MKFRLVGESCDAEVTKLSIVQSVSQRPRFLVTLSNWKNFQTVTAARHGLLSVTYGSCVLFENLEFATDSDAELSDDTSMLLEVPLSFSEPTDPGLNRVLDVPLDATSLRSVVQRCFPGFASCDTSTANLVVPVLPRHISQGNTPSLLLLANLVSRLETPTWISLCFADPLAPKWILTGMAEDRRFDGSLSVGTPLPIVGYTTTLGSVAGHRLARAKESVEDILRTVFDGQAIRIAKDILTPMPLCVGSAPGMIGTKRIDHLAVTTDNELDWKSYLDVFDAREWWTTWCLGADRAVLQSRIETGVVSSHSTGDASEIVLECEIAKQSGNAVCHTSTLSTGSERDEGVFAIPFSKAEVVIAMPASFHSTLVRPVILGEIRKLPMAPPATSSNESAPAKTASFIAFREGLTLSHSAGGATISLNQGKCFWTKNQKASIVLTEDTVEILEKLG